MIRMFDWALVLRLFIGTLMIYAAVYRGSRLALFMVLWLTMLSCEALAYSLHVRARQ